MKSEKLNLIIIFTIFFILSSSLMYVMIAKDIKLKDDQIKKMNRGESRIEENNWPKIEIETRK